jgi:hypothetical protein
VDEKTNLLLAANQQEVDNNPDDMDPEKAIENPGMYHSMNRVRAASDPLSSSTRH